MKKVLVLAGGSDQIALIEELHRYGIMVVLVDYFSNPPAKPYADKHVQISTLDVDAVIKVALDEKVDLITTACTDQALLTVAESSEKLGLPCYISHQTALNVTNKAYMKQVLTNNQIPTARYLITNSASELDERLKGFEYPLVVKPVDCNSSKGVKRVENFEMLEYAINTAVEYSRTNNAVIEEFKEGQELSCDFFVEDGIAKMLSVTSSKKIRNRSSFTIVQSYYPAIDKNEEKIILLIAQRIVDAFSLKNCPLLVQMIHNENGYYVLEFSARMGGGSKYKLIEVLTGVNIIKEYVKLVLGLPVSICPSRDVDYVTMNYVYCNSGIFSSTKGLEDLRSEGVVKCYFEYKTDGMHIDKAETSGDRAAGYLLIAKTAEEMKEKIDYVDKRISVLDMNGKDIMIHGLS